MDPELAKYGERFLSGYERRALLGRGGCAVVWLAVDQAGTLVAIKQVLKGSSVKHRADLDAARRELAVADLLFHEGVPRVSPKEYPGIDYVARTLDRHETKTDVWIVMEYGGRSLSKALFEVKGEFFRGARIYGIQLQPFYNSLHDPAALKDFLRQVLLALDVLACHGIVHGDIKPDNILIRQEGEQFTARLIDFGSAFNVEYPESLGLATPEYMPPEALGSIAGRFHPPERMSGMSAPWAIDMWALGCIFLEILVGVPLWMSYKVRVEAGGRSVMTTGLFAVAGRDPEKIRAKQHDVIRKLPRVVENSVLPLSSSGADLLSRMLAWNASERISPDEAMEHPFLCDYPSDGSFTP